MSSLFYLLSEITSCSCKFLLHFRTYKCNTLHNTNLLLYFTGILEKGNFRPFIVRDVIRKDKIMVVVQSCRIMWFLILSVLPPVVRTLDASTVLIDLRNWSKLFGIVDDTWEYNSLSACVWEPSEMSVEKGGCNHRTPRGDGARKRDLESQWVSVASPFSPATVGPRQAGLPFLSFLSRVSLSWPILLRPRRPHSSFSFVFTQSCRKNFHPPPVSLAHS